MTEPRASGTVRELSGPVPDTLDGALDPAFLTRALGRAVASVETVELLRTVATKVRFAATFEDGSRDNYCLKGLLDVDEMSKLGGSTCVLEGDFYLKVSPLVNVQVPEAKLGG